MSQHQAQGLQRLFSGHGAKLVNVLAGPSFLNPHDFILRLAAELAKHAPRVWLAERGAGELSAKLGCRPLRPWQANQPLDEQVIDAGAYGLLHAPGCLAGDPVFARAAAACRNCDTLLFDGGRFSLAEAPLAPETAQTLVVLLGNQDAEAGYALVKALRAARSPARVLLLGETAEAVAQAARHFADRDLENLGNAPGLCQIGNNGLETSSNTLTIESNLTWVVSRITQNDQPKVAYGDGSEGAEEIYKR